MKFARVALVILPTAFALAACVPYYYKETHVPEIRGTLMRDGVPVRGVEVLLAQKVVKTRPCEILKPAAVTDDQGAFTIPMQRTSRFFRALLNPPELVLRVTAVCFRAPGEAPVYGGHFVTRSHIPVSIQIACDETRSERDSLIDASAICRGPLSRAMVDRR
jgi:hypothetical protein